MTTSPDQNYTSWHVGMKVVCVDRFRDYEIWEKLPEVGEVYTIRSMEVAPDGDLYVWLVEVRNVLAHYLEGFVECRFRAAKFRPVQTRQTDISCFEALLKTVPSKETV